MTDLQFVREDWTLFRSLNTLSQRAGVTLSRLGAVVVKELADNALDAGATVEVSRDADGYVVITDDGPGIPGTPEQVAQLFSIRRPLTSSKLVRLPTRGALGNGLRVVAGAVLASNGELMVDTRGQLMELTPKDDGSTAVRVICPGETEHAGTKVYIKLGEGLKLDTSMALLASAISGCADSGFRGKSSPHWYDEQAFFEMLQAAGTTPVKRVMELLDGGKGLPAQIPVSNDGTRPAFSTALPSNSLERIQAVGLLVYLQQKTRHPRPQVLGSVGKLPDRGYGRVACEFNPSGNSVTDGFKLPAVVEAWAKKVEDGKGEIKVMVNRTPITAEVEFRRIKNKGAVFGCELSNYIETGRMDYEFMLNIQTPYMPVTNDGKEPNLRPLIDAISRALKSAASGARRLSPTGKPQESKKDLVWGAIPAAITKASGNGKFRYSLRQLYYAVRPLLQSEGMELDYGYFADLVTQYETARRSDLPGIYRDARGTLYHPHTGEQMALGTLNVEKYQRPEYLFNKVLYIEKGGFFPLLIENGWPERFDCALLTSQGFASRAARDVIDLLGDTDEELTFYCIHDADGPGTMIYEALQEARSARPARRVRIVNLGLEPAEGRRMGLEVEQVKRKNGKVPVADYVPHDDERWLQSHRIELNAMDSETFIRWLSSKMAAHDRGKVVPPARVLEETYRRQAKDAVRTRLAERILREAGLDARVEEAMTKLPDRLTDDQLDQRLRTIDKNTSWRSVLEEEGRGAGEELIVQSIGENP